MKSYRDKNTLFFDMRRVLLLLILFSNLHFHEVMAQSEAEYKFSPAVDVPLGAIIFGTGVTGFVKHKRNQPFTEYEVNQLAYSVNSFDYSSINRSYNKRIHIVSDVGMVMGILAPFVLLSDKKIRQQSKYILPIGIETFMMSFAITSMTKELVQRTRPYVYYDDVPMSEKIRKDARASFFSGHTSMTATGTFFSAMVYTQMHPNSKWKPLVWTGAAAFPLGVGLLRYSGGKHYWTDILTGYLVGATIGVLVPHLHKKR